MFSQSLLGSIFAFHFSAEGAAIIRRSHSIAVLAPYNASREINSTVGFARIKFDPTKPEPPIIKSIGL